MPRAISKCRPSVFRITSPHPRSLDLQRNTAHQLTVLSILGTAVARGKWRQRQTYSSLIGSQPIRSVVAIRPNLISHCLVEPLFQIWIIL